MTHRSIEHTETEAQLRLAFAHPAFAVHAAVPATFGDEGAANHMRLTASHGEPGVEVFVYGEEGGKFPARQNRRASEAVARRHGLSSERTLFVAQSQTAIDAGAFHNDVVAVANENVLFAHEHAFADPDRAQGRSRPVAARQRSSSKSPPARSASPMLSGPTCSIRSSSPSPTAAWR